jgi:Tol biopolymer transport system component
VLALACVAWAGATAEAGATNAGSTFVNSYVTLAGGKITPAPFDPARSRAISADGRYVVLTLASPRLHGTPQVYRRDMKTGRLLLISRMSGKSGAKSEGSGFASISNDGSRIAFSSVSPLVPADDDGAAVELDVYVRDIERNRTFLVSRANGESGADASGQVFDGAISGNGRRVAFSAPGSGFGFGCAGCQGDPPQVFVRSIASGRTTPVGFGNGASLYPSISDDGNVVAFLSLASNLSPGDAGEDPDIYVAKLGRKNLSLASRAPGLSGAASPGADQYPAISGNGKVVAFTSDLRALTPGSRPWVTGSEQVVSRVLATGHNTLVSKTAGGQVGDGLSRSPALNRDGSVIAFSTTSTNLTARLGGSAVLVRNMKSGRLFGPPPFGQPDDLTSGSVAPTISANGKCVAFAAKGENSVAKAFGATVSGYVFVASGTCPNPRR